MESVATAEVTRDLAAPTTDSRFGLRRVAISYIEPGGSVEELRLQEVDLETYPLSQREIIERYLNEHLERAWTLPESGRTLSANFTPESVVKKAWNRVLKNPVRFMDEGRGLAERLLQETPPWASPGVLLLLFFKAGGTPYLGLFKLDPGAHDRIWLKTGPAGKLLLELAAKHVRYELPEPGERVLKWAITPHPSNPEYQIKLRDEQGPELAIYFARFLECEDYIPEPDQASTVIERALTHARDKERLAQVPQAIQQLLAKAAQAGRAIDLDELMNWLAEVGLVEAGDRDAFEDTLADTPAERLRVASDVLQRLRVEYRLKPCSLVISGNIADVLSLVDVTEQGGQYRFCMEAPDYAVRVRG